MVSAPIHDDKAEVRARLDLAGAVWCRAPGSKPAEPLVEYTFVRHDDGDFDEHY